MIRPPHRSTRSDSFPTRRSSDLDLADVVDPHQAGRVAALGVVQGHLRRVAGRVVARGGRIAEDGFQRTPGFVPEAVEGVLQARRGHGCGPVGGEGASGRCTAGYALRITATADRKSEVWGKGVVVRVDLGG